VSPVSRSGAAPARVARHGGPPAAHPRRGLRVWVALTTLPLAVTPLLAADAPDPVPTASRAIDAGDYVRHVQTLSSDDFEGRAPGTRGETQTVAYLKKQFAAQFSTPAH